jgi:hypothetical protein
LLPSLLLLLLLLLSLLLLRYQRRLLLLSRWGAPVVSLRLVSWVSAATPKASGM